MYLALKQMRKKTKAERSSKTDTFNDLKKKAHNACNICYWQNHFIICFDYDIEGQREKANEQSTLNSIISKYASLSEEQCIFEKSMACLNDAFKHILFMFSPISPLRD